MLNDLIELLADVPPTTAIAWAAWLTAGLLLSMWHRRAKRWLVVHHATASYAAKPKSGVRPPSGVPPARREPQTGSFTTGDAFGELEALLEPTPSGLHRRPGDDVLREPSPVLAGPKALP